MARETIETARLIRDGPPLELLVIIIRYTCKHDGYYKFIIHLMHVKIISIFDYKNASIFVLSTVYY